MEFKSLFEFTLRSSEVQSHHFWYIHLAIYSNVLIPPSAAIECSSLSDIENGRVIVPSRSVGSVAHYTCNSGFALEGNESRTCQSNGQWSSAEPVCRRKEQFLSDVKICIIIIY